MQYSYAKNATPPYQPTAEPRTNRAAVAGLMGPISFGPFVVDLMRARVFRDGQEIPLRPQVFRVLQFLIQNSGRLVDFDEMLAEAWAGAKVSKHTVAVTLRELKDVLGEYGSWITIRPGYGYSLEIPESEHLMRVGQHFRSQYTRSGLDSALRCFEQVTEIEGANVRAWESLAGLHIEIGFLSVRPPREVNKAFQQAYQRVVALKGLTPGLQLDRAVSLYRFEWKFAEAEAELLRVLQDHPKLTRVYVHLAMVYYLMGRTDDAFEELGNAEKADPLLPALAFVKPRLLLYCREANAAAACAKQAVALHPNSPLTHLTYAHVLDFGGDPAALAEYHIASTIAPDIPWIKADEARSLATQGRSGEALEILSQLQGKRQEEYVDAYPLAFLLEALGRRDEAFQELERAYAERSPMMFWLDRDTRSDTLRDDPRFAPLRDRVSSAVLSN
jgi:DNA-binding winged helix-turn-helix (wHTH) protein/Flp pilus assembly protein TadD